MQQAIVCRRKRLRITQSHPLRGPKPVRALREIGLAANVTTDEPTTTTTRSAVPVTWARGRPRGKCNEVRPQSRKGSTQCHTRRLGRVLNPANSHDWLLLVQLPAVVCAVCLSRSAGVFGD